MNQGAASSRPFGLRPYVAALTAAILAALFLFRNMATPLASGLLVVSNTLTELV
jgi:hypothetical protein